MFVFFINFFSRVLLFTLFTFGSSQELLIGCHLDARLIASDGQENAGFAQVVDVFQSSAVVGAFGQDAEVGTAYVLLLNRGIWSQNQRLNSTHPTQGGHFGWSASIFQDWIAVGAPGENQGNVYLFQTLNEANYTLMQVLSNSTLGTNAAFGTAVILSDGRLAVGAPGVDQVFLYSLSPSDVWTLDAILTSQPGTQFGSSISMRGSMMVIGAPGNNSAFMFPTSSSESIQLVPVNQSRADVSTLNFGSSSAIGPNSSHILVGSYQEFSNAKAAGAAYLFSGEGDPIERMVPQDIKQFNHFGEAITIVTINGVDWAILGAHRETVVSTEGGRVYMYPLLNSSLQSDMGINLMPNNMAAYAWYGRAVASSPASNNRSVVIIVGASQDESMKGAVYLWQCFGIFESIIWEDDDGQYFESFPTEDYIIIFSVIGAVFLAIGIMIVLRLVRQRMKKQSTAKNSQGHIPLDETEAGEPQT